MAVHDKPSQRKLPAWMTLNAEGENEQFTHDTNENPNLSFMGTVHYCRTEKECGRACESLMKQVETQEELVIGFDMEWPVHFKTGSGKTALIQICAEEQTCYLFHVSCMRSLPEAFVHLLKHPKFKLVGVNIKKVKECTKRNISDKEAASITCDIISNAANYTDIICQ
ncbi:Werner Syndrome-like exonuclease isoform X3 [Cryptotermes secundus]|uniref:Werner Syndrome-like exonuclease isoform X3 n=1 Tax=Cryptotermes secundus TaxID=105785 RepID=UPI000CD7B169|nr:Werner Syndrome-like exonuclease isoform X3 [Cryptotermes secundus]